MALIWGGDTFSVGSGESVLFNTTEGAFSRAIFNPTAAVPDVVLFNTTEGAFNRAIFNPTTGIPGVVLFNTQGVFNKRMFNPTHAVSRGRFQPLVGASPMFCGLIK